MAKKCDVNNCEEAIENQNIPNDSMLKVSNDLINQTIMQSAKKILSKHKYAFEVLGDVKNS